MQRIYYAWALDISIALHIPVYKPYNQSVFPIALSQVNGDDGIHEKAVFGILFLVYVVIGNN